MSIAAVENKPIEEMIENFGEQGNIVRPDNHEVTLDYLVSICRFFWDVDVIFKLLSIPTDGAIAYPYLKIIEVNTSFDTKTKIHILLHEMGHFYAHYHYGVKLTEENINDLTHEAHAWRFGGALAYYLNIDLDWAEWHDMNRKSIEFNLKENDERLPLLLTMTALYNLRLR